MRHHSERDRVEVFCADSSDSDVEIRSYRAIAGILSERYGREVSVKNVGRSCTSAERRLAAGLQSDPVIQRWLRRQQIEIVNEGVGATSG